MWRLRIELTFVLLTMGDQETENTCSSFITGHVIGRTRRELEEVPPLGYIPSSARDSIPQFLTYLPGVRRPGADNTSAAISPITSHVSCVSWGAAAVAQGRMRLPA